MNIKCHNLRVEGVNFEPFDSGDKISHALFNLQSVDGDHTRNIDVSGVTCREVVRLFECDLSGLTDAVGFENISFNDFDVSLTASPESNLIIKSEGFYLNNIKIFDPSETLLVALEIEDSRDVHINNAYFEIRRSATEFTVGGSGCSDIHISNSRFIVPDSQTGNTLYKTLQLQYSNNTALTDVHIDNVTVSIPSYAASSGQTIVLCDLIKSTISNLKMVIRDVGVANPGTALFGTFVDCLIDGVHLIGAGKTGTLYAVQDDASSAENSICNVRSDERGVLIAGGDSMISNIAAFTTPINDTGAGNTSGTTHTFT